MKAILRVISALEVRLQIRSPLIICLIKFESGRTKNTANGNGLTMMEQSNKYRIFVLLLLMLTYLFSYMDRQILSILIEDIGNDFTLNDTQRGLLMGLAFALFYAGLGVPVAWLADRTNRKNIIAGAVTIWSIATALCATATGFWSLFAARVGVGIGEAGGTPPAHSILGDYFKKSELTRALSVYSLGPALGAALGLMAGGWLADQVGWRMTFVIVGLPGILLGIIVYFTVREPQRGRFVVDASEPMVARSFKETFASLCKQPAYIGILTGHMLQVMCSFILMSWSAVIMIRTFNASTSEVGLFLGLGVLFGAPPGMIAGGFLADKMGYRDARWMAWIPAIVLLIAMPFYVGAMFVNSLFMMAFLICIGGFFVAFSYAPGIGIIQTIVQPDERALASSLLFLTASLVGLGLGPIVSGWLSDTLRPTYGLSSINIAVAVSQVFFIPSAMFYYWTASKLKDHSIRDD